MQPAVKQCLQTVTDFCIIRCCVEGGAGYMDLYAGNRAR